MEESIPTQQTRARLDRLLAEYERTQDPIVFHQAVTVSIDRTCDQLEDEALGIEVRNRSYHNPITSLLPTKWP